MRAQWAARPFVWHIYPQRDDAHRVKFNLHGTSLATITRVSDTQSIKLDVTALDPAFEKAIRAVGEISQGDLIDHPERVKQLSVLEAPNASNQFGRLVLRNEARQCSVIVVEWSAQ